MGRIRQRRRTKQPDLRILPLERRTRRPQHPRDDSPRQLVPSDMAPPFWFVEPRFLRSPSESPEVLIPFRLPGNIFIQTNLGTEIFDYKNNIEVSDRNATITSANVLILFFARFPFLIPPHPPPRLLHPLPFHDDSTLSPTFLTQSEPTLDLVRPL